MPVYRGIVITLHSQFNIDIFPEYPARPQEYYAERGIPGKAPELFDEATSTANVFVPVFPGSQFWIAYSVRPPVPDDQQFFFKLFINGSHIVSWATGKEEKWKGKTMFGLYERDDGDGRKKVEKRALCFTPPTGGYGSEWADVQDVFDETAAVEIRVFRAHGKKRTTRELEQFGDSEYAKHVRGINMVNAGHANSEHPKRFYRVALIDPTDRPYVTFRYFYRTWEQLFELDVVEDDESEYAGTEYSIIEPQSADNADVETLSGPATPRRARVVNGESLLDDVPELHAHTTEDSSEDAVIKGSGYVTSAPGADDNESCVPPPLQLNAPKFSLKFSPQKLLTREKKDKTPEEMGAKAHPEYPMDEWVVRTPSPVKSMREGISTPSLTPRKGFTATGIIGAITSTFRRVGGAGSESSGSRNNSRAASR